MNKKDDTISTRSRRQNIVQLLEHAPDGGLTVLEIYERLKNKGIKVPRRTVDRDIIHLSREYGLVSDDSYPKKLSLSPDFKIHYEIPLTESSIQTLTVALGLLGKLGPQYFSRLVHETEDALIAKLPKSIAKEFSRLDELLRVQNSAPGKAVLKVSENLDCVLTALRKGLVFECRYDSQNINDKDPNRIRKFGAILIEFYVGTPYLLVQDLDEKACMVKRLRISRIREASLTQTPYIRPPRKVYEKHLDSYAAVSPEDSGPVEITILGNKKLFDYFSNFELHPTQVITEEGEDQYRMNLRMPLAYPLARTLAGVGGMITDIRPAKLKGWVRELCKRGAEALG